MPKYSSQLLSNLVHDMEGASLEERVKIWAAIETPLIEDIPADSDNCLVTFLYRFDQVDTPKPSIYLYSSITGLPCSESSKLSFIAGIDIGYLSLVLPRTLRSAYNFLIVDEPSLNKAFEPAEMAPIFPRTTGAFKAADDLLLPLYEQEKVKTDYPRNKKEITFYKDYDNPIEFFAKESILELPAAPSCKYIPESMGLVRAKQHKLRMTHRFIADEVSFSKTCLNNVDGYKDEKEEKRKYWIYLPPSYDKNAQDAYPFMLFLDGSDYLNPIPTTAILDGMIKDRIIPPCVAVFLEYSNHRFHEYNCNEQFTAFLANDFMKILRDNNQLNITEDPKLSTIVGLSASGLAAFYAALTYPEVFGNVISQSPSWVLQQTHALETLINNHCQFNQETQFIFEMGSYETIPIDMEFEDGNIQSLSPFEANKQVVASMQNHGLMVTEHEFVGGHNNGCWGVSLPNRIAEICNKRLEEKRSLALGASI